MSEPALQGAIRKLNISSIRNIVSTQPTEASSVIGTVLHQIVHDRVLVIKRADLELRSTRDEFITGLRKLVAEMGTDLQAIELDHIIRQSAITQSLFDKLLIQLDAFAGLRSHQLDLVWACILLAQKEVSNLARSVVQKLDDVQSKKNDSISVNYTFGNATVDIDADELLFKIEQVLSTQLQWFAFTQKLWKRDFLELPAGSLKASALLVPLATLLRELSVRWDSVDQSDVNVSIFGGEVVKITKPDGEDVLIEYRENQVEKKAIYTAGKRLKSSISRTHFTSSSEGDYQVAPLSPIEARDFALFEEITGHSPFNVKLRLEGLVPWQWIRGYTALSQISQFHLRSQHSETPICMKSEELLGELAKFGLNEDAGKKFVELASYALKSTDMYDCPIIRVNNNCLVVLPFVSAIQSGTRLVISQCARFGTHIPKVGTSLEKYVVALFQQTGAIARRIKETIGSQTFQIDCLALWEDVLFVIECKNQILAKESERSRQLFWNDQLKHVSQLLRNVAFVRDNETLIRSRLASNGKWKHVTPMVVHGMPFSLATPLSGVAFVDKHILTQFFTTGRSLDFPDIRFWTGDGPRPEDLVYIGNCNRVVERLVSQFQEEHSEFLVTETCKVRNTHLR
jgi:hypothetical protein